MKTLLKRISIHSLWIFLGLVALSLVIIDGPELRLVKVSASGALEKVVVTGEVVYTRGMTARLSSGRRAMLFGTAQFEATLPNGVYRSDVLLEQIESGVVPLGETKWQVHWEVFPSPISSSGW